MIMYDISIELRGVKVLSLYVGGRHVLLKIKKKEEKTK